MKRLTKVSAYIFYALITIILIVIGLFFWGGSMKELLVSNHWNPANLDYLFALIVIFFAMTLILILASFIMHVCILIKSHGIKVLKYAIGCLFLIALLIVTWLLGNGKILGGAELSIYNTKGWLKISDMFIYSIEILLSITVLLIIVSYIKRKFVD